MERCKALPFFCDELQEVPQNQQSYSQNPRVKTSI